MLNRSACPILNSDGYGCEQPGDNAKELAKTKVYQKVDNRNENRKHPNALDAYRRTVEFIIIQIYVNFKMHYSATQITCNVRD